jgi:hypothetical protein
MQNNIERDLGEQPIARIMKESQLEPHDLVVACANQITHKMVSRAAKGRRLTPSVKFKILYALNAAAKKSYTLQDLFNY